MDDKTCPQQLAKTNEVIPTSNDINTEQHSAAPYSYQDNPSKQTYEICPLVTIVDQEPYSLQRPLRRPQNRTEIVVAGIDDQWSADLMDMVKFSKYNKEYKYVLVVIDVFSKYLWLRKLKDKKGESVATAFQDIFQTGRVPNKIRTDMGQEFKAKRVQTVFKKEEINHFYAFNEVKASVSERVIKQ
ncbi:unnamed protein product [Mytilus edulis]|uniref:Integrase catalytic domain-containing protein n=1 Tax=Mytilus edulis TaxID=6550 RepID=A0A8S3S7J7_MYTED|nr:unnamed protein product [Mytilus edulis]